MRLYRARGWVEKADIGSPYRPSGCQDAGISHPVLGTVTRRKLPATRMEIWQSGSRQHHSRHFWLLLTQSPRFALLRVRRVIPAITAASSISAALRGPLFRKARQATMHCQHKASRPARHSVMPGVTELPALWPRPVMRFAWKLCGVEPDRSDRPWRHRQREVPHVRSRRARAA